MSNAWWTRGLGLVVALAVLAALAGACGQGKASSAGNTMSGAGGGGQGGNDGLGGSFGNPGDLVSITVTPGTAAIESLNGAPVTQAFTATGKLKDGTSQVLTSVVTWAASGPQIGGIDSTGLYTASGSVGGVVPVTATYQGVTGAATLTVELHLSANTAMAPAAVETALQGASQPDAAVVWAYPYDGTVWPRGLLPPVLQWNGGAATDLYYVHVQCPTFVLEDYLTATNAPSSRLPFDPTSWQKMVDSTTGPTQITVARWDGTAATTIATQTWTIAAASMRGTIYYWSNDLGRVLRIKPGATTPDDFANQPPLSDPTQFQQDTCLMTCHTVSADGSTLVSGGGTYAGSYDLKAGMPLHSLGGTWGLDPNQFGGHQWQNIAWYQPALSPDGKYVLTNSMGQGGVTSTGGPNTDMDLFTTADGMPVAASGVSGVPFAEPAWSPEGSRVAFVDSGDPSGWFNNWQTPPAGDLKVIQFDATKSPMFSGPQTMVGVGTANLITWPTVTPDGQWVVYARAQSADTRQGNGDLYIASAVTPNQEARLARLDGDGYPFAAGARDLSWNFEPSFAPVAAGGYFWVVFTSRRTYGNILTGDKTVVKQLWVAAIDQQPTPGKDASHPAFHLTGQVETNLAMRGFWALDPCKADGQGCMSGTECCGGFCDPQNMNTCSSTGGACSQVGDKCNTAADCCDAATGVVCINHVCSEPAAQ